MKKLFRILPVLAFLFAAGSAVLSQAEVKPTTYYRWNSASPSQCVTETECQENGPFACGHTAYNGGTITNCENVSILRKVSM